MLKVTGGGDGWDGEQGAMALHFTVKE